MLQKITPLLLLICLGMAPRENTVHLALLKYQGGGDWYANPTALPNLAQFANQELGAGIHTDYATVEVGSRDIFNYAYIYMTGHGNVVFSESERRNLRLYLEAGGFLHIDDNYGMDPYVRKQLQELYPEKELEPLPADHPLFHQTFKFPEGLPKIHEHDGKPPVAYVIRQEGKIVILYTHESDLGNGWEDPAVHNDPPEVRRKALQMGSNILQYIFNGQDG